MAACVQVCWAVAIALVGSLASATAAGADSIGRANLDGSGVRPGFITMATPFTPDGIAVAGGHIYWADPSPAWSTDAACQQPAPTTTAAPAAVRST